MAKFMRVFFNCSYVDLLFDGLFIYPRWDLKLRNCMNSERWHLMSNTWSIYWHTLSWSKRKWAIPEKNQTEAGWGNGNFRGIEEIVCGNSRGQLEKKWNIQECSRKNHRGICMGLAFWSWDYKWCYTILQNFQGCESLISTELLRVKWQI